MITTKHPASKRLAIQRTVIPLCYDPRDQEGFNKWANYIDAENRQSLGSQALDQIKKHLQELSSC